MERVARNAPCPCGSGKKYKACCGTGDKTRSGAGLGKILGVVVGIVVIVGFLIAVDYFREADLSADGATPEPWEYDAAQNRHWNPLPGHEHWHNGPPPQNGGAATLPGTGSIPAGQAPATAPPALPVATEPVEGEPEAWHYDADNDRHWNPATKNWDAGMPPLEAFTSGNN